MEYSGGESVGPVGHDLPRSLGLDSAKGAHDERIRFAEGPVLTGEGLFEAPFYAVSQLLGHVCP